MERILLAIIAFPIFALYIRIILLVGTILSNDRNDFSESIISSYALSCVLNTILTILLICKYL